MQDGFIFLFLNNRYSDTDIHTGVKSETISMAQNVNPRTSTSIEFVVRPREDLYLRGGVRTIPRVSAGEGYPCQMQKNQTFSCLFRHYAKHNGLRKDDLVFYFVNELHPDEMPETVHLMPFDEVWVEHKKTDIECSRNAEKFVTFSSEIKSLLETASHADVSFIVGTSNKERIHAHKAILSARCPYFRAMFRPGGMMESISDTIEVPSHDSKAFKKMLEYIYSNDVQGLESSSANDIIDTLVLSNEYLLTDLTRLCENAASKILNIDNIGSFMLICDKYETSRLREACHAYVTDNISTLKLEESFRREVAESPELALLLVDAIPEQDHQLKKRRTVTTESIPTVNTIVNAPPNTINAIWHAGTVPQLNNPTGFFEL